MKTTHYFLPRWISFLSVAFIFGSALQILHAADPAPQMSAAGFEKMFLQSMPDHHSTAVQMSQICLEKTQRPELRTLCQQIITSQQREIGLMQGWLNNWYELQKTPQLSAEQRDM